MQKDTSRDEKTVSILVPSVASATRALIPNRISETLLIFKNVLHGQERPDDERYYIIHRDLEQMEPKVISLTPSEGGKLVILLHHIT
jgi:hypothetical protein